MRDSYIIQSQW